MSWKHVVACSSLLNNLFLCFLTLSWIFLPHCLHESCSLWPLFTSSASLLLSRWQTQIQLNVQRGLSAVSHLIPSQPPNLQLSYRSLLCFSLQVPLLPRRSWKHTPLDRNPTDVAPVVVEGCEANTVNTRPVTHCDLFNVGGLIAANCCHIPNESRSGLTPLSDVDQHRVQMRSEFVLDQLQAEDSDRAQCIVQVVCVEWRQRHSHWHSHKHWRVGLDLFVTPGEVLVLF